MKPEIRIQAMSNGEGVPVEARRYLVSETFATIYLSEPPERFSTIDDLLEALTKARDEREKRTKGAKLPSGIIIRADEWQSATIECFYVRQMTDGERAEADRRAREWDALREKQDRDHYLKLKARFEPSGAAPKEGDPK